MALHVKIACIAINQTPMAWSSNKARLKKALLMASAAGVQILCLQEQVIGGYNQEDWHLSPAGQRRQIQTLKELIPLTKGMVTCFGMTINYDNSAYNAVAVVADGKLLGFCCKKDLASDGIHYENRVFKPWPKGVRTTISIEGLGEDIPIGDIYFIVGGVKIGFEICEEAWVAQRSGGWLARKGMDFILNPSMSHFAYGKCAIRSDFVVDGSRRFMTTYMYANGLGNEAGRAIYDGSCMIASGGVMLAFGQRFSLKDMVMTTAVVDVQKNRQAQMASASRIPLIGEEPGECVRGEMTWVSHKPAINVVEKEPWETGSDLKFEEFTRAQILGLWDYNRKTRQWGFTNSLSGGVDSSVVAVLVAKMAERVVQELGMDEALERISYIKMPKRPKTARQLSRILLTCAYQGTENSSETTLNAARKVAQATGATWYNLNIDPLFKGYVAMVSKAIGRPITWETDDLPLQNIQARVRSPGIWMIANIKRQILITTSNRSEATKGYCTQDGDTSGGYAPLNGQDKTFLRLWLVWMEHKGPWQLKPVKALHFVNVQQPTAELRQQSSKQTDEDDLGPYVVSDALEGMAIRDKMSPMEGFDELVVLFPQYSPRDLARWTEDLYVRWCASQWKRERSAPSPHLDDHNVDPKTGCRFPILSGGFFDELSELAQHVNDNYPLAAAA